MCIRDRSLLLGRKSEFHVSFRWLIGCAAWAIQFWLPLRYPGVRAYPAPTPGYLSGNQNWIAQAAHPINQRKDTWNSDFLPSNKDRLQFRRIGFASTRIF